MRGNALARRNPVLTLSLATIAALAVGLGGLAYAITSWWSGGGSPSAMLSIAGSYLGVKEDPPGSNRGPVVDLFNRGTGQRWCGWFVSYVLRRAGIATMDYPSVKELHDKAARLGALSSSPSAGAVFLHVTGTGITGAGFDHTGFVASVYPDGTWQSIEGNASDKVETHHHPWAGESFVFVPFGWLRQVFTPGQPGGQA
jgi:hypothetical protein